MSIRLHGSCSPQIVGDDVSSVIEIDIHELSPQDSVAVHRTKLVSVLRATLLGNPPGPPVTSTEVQGNRAIITFAAPPSSQTVYGLAMEFLFDSQ